MDLALPPMPFSTVFVPDASGNSILRIPEEMRNAGLGSPPTVIELPVGVVQVIVTWKGVEPISIRHFTGNTSTYETVATIPASSTVGDRSTGVMTFASDKRHGILLFRGGGSNWNATTLSNGYVAGVQVMPMGTAADITGGGSLLRVDNSVGTRVFLGDQMIHGDTGWRNISDTAVLAPHNGARILVRRMGDTVWFNADQYAPTEPTSSTFMKIPRGFSPGNKPFRIGAGGVYEADAAIYTAGYDLRSIGTISAGQRRFYVSWVADDSWPTTLPGTPA